MTEDAAPDGGPPPAFRFFNEVAIIDQLASRAFERVLAPELTVAQFSVLNHLVRVRPTTSPQRLARAFQVAKSAMTKTLGHLEGKRLIAVRPDPQDGRAKLVEITDDGRTAHAGAVAAIGPLLRELTAAIPPARLEAALPLLAEVRAWLDARRDRD